MNSIITKLNQRIDSANSLLCVGLDSDLQRIPAQADPQLAFNKTIIQQTNAFVCAYKPNLAFYEARGDAGWRDLQKTLDFLRENYPEIVTIGDAKRADIGSTSAAYARALFDHLGFDAVTLNPYLGQNALEPFLSRTDKACIILCRTSNPGAEEFQGLKIGDRELWEVVAQRVAEAWNTAGNCMLVVGANQPQAIRRVREIVGDMPLLVPGIGAQGGDLVAVVHAGRDSQGRGLLVNASRSIIFAENPAESAQKLRDSINQARMT